MNLNQKQDKITIPIILKVIFIYGGTVLLSLISASNLMGKLYRYFYGPYINMHVGVIFDEGIDTFIGGFILGLGAAAYMTFGQIVHSDGSDTRMNTAFGYRLTSTHTIMDMLAEWKEKSPLGRLVFEFANFMAVVITGLSFGLGAIGGAWTTHSASEFSKEAFWGFTWGDVTELVVVAVASFGTGFGIRATMKSISKAG